MMVNKKLFITVGVLIFIILITGCINEEKIKEKLGDEILNIGKCVPKGWNYEIIIENIEEIERPHSLENPLAIMNFTNPNIEFGYYPGVDTDKKYNPSLQLYFYDITKKQEIMEIIDKEKIYSWCIPIYFDETKKYIIVTSPCYINHGIFTDEAMSYYSPLEISLKDYFEKFK